MIFTSESERQFVGCIARLVYTNPFLPERIEGERTALGEAFIPGDRVWNALADPARELSNVVQIGDRADALALSVRERLAGGAKASSEDVELYEQLVYYVLYHRSRERLAELADTSPNPDGPAIPAERPSRQAPFYADFARDAEHFL